MAANKEDIRIWFMKALKDKATHMIIVCDTFDWEDFPAYVFKNEDVTEVMNKYDGINMCKIMEVYKMSEDMETQLNLTRCYNI